MRILPVLVGLTILGCSGDAVETTTSTVGTTTTAAAVASSSTEAGGFPVEVYFVDEAAFAAGTEPYVVAVPRTITGDSDLEALIQGALEALYAGPSASETGLVAATSGTTGVADVRVEDGVARITLAGPCSSGGSTLTIANLIFPTVHQFEEVMDVKIYDEAGQTAEPTGPGDSMPACLEP